MALILILTSVRVLKKKLKGSELVYLQLKTYCVSPKMSILILKETCIIWNLPTVPPKKNPRLKNHAQYIIGKLSELQSYKGGWMHKPKSTISLAGKGWILQTVHNHQRTWFLNPRNTWSTSDVQSLPLSVNGRGTCIKTWNSWPKPYFKMYLLWSYPCVIPLALSK